MVIIYDQVMMLLHKKHVIMCVIFSIHELPLMMYFQQDPGSGLGGGPATGCPVQAPKNDDYPTACPGPENR
jgi:hypothetical protein